ncbi:MAG: hypothetical protein ABR583_01655, partial [Gaiellaceae bacterium]
MASRQQVDGRAVAIEALYRRSYRRFLGVLSTITGDYATGHDALQEAFARASHKSRRPSRAREFRRAGLRLLTQLASRGGWGRVGQTLYHMIGGGGG